MTKELETALKAARTKIITEANKADVRVNKETLEALSKIEAGVPVSDLSLKEQILIIQHQKETVRENGSNG